jgi:hypothetical protein
MDSVGKWALNKPQKGKGKTKTDQFPESLRRQNALPYKKIIFFSQQNASWINPVPDKGPA